MIYNWDFGDGTAHGTNHHSSHAFAAPGNYTWKVVASVQGSPAFASTNSGSILIGEAAGLAATLSGNSVVISWPQVPEALLEQSALLGQGASWTVSPVIARLSAGRYSITVPNQGMIFYRLRKL